ncbi:MAG TPA: glycosyltransferase [Bryobacteraceae bacterium]|nr:glycosyltransferase [Bryobacteraceae bacterium]
MPPVDVLLMIYALGDGGSERQLANTALSLDRSRFNPHVASVREGFQADALRRAGIPVIHMPLRSFVSPSAVRVARQIRSYIRENRIRLVHPFDFTLGLLAIPVAKTCPGVAALSSQRCYMDLVPRKYRRPLLVAHRLADGLVVNSEELRRDLVERYSYPASRIHVCHNGLDTERFSAAGRKRGGDLVIGTACVLRPEKNVGHLLEAFARVRAMRPGMKLLIVGSGPERESLVAKSEALGLADICTFQPTTADVPAVIREIDIFVHPSLTEGLPNAVMEAMACECAVVASRVGGCPELIEDGKTGLLTEPGDIESLTASLASVVANDQLRESLAGAGARSMQSFSLARSAARMQEIYERVLTGSGLNPEAARG